MFKIGTFTIFSAGATIFCQSSETMNTRQYLLTENEVEDIKFHKEEQSKQYLLREKEIEEKGFAMQLITLIEFYNFVI